MSNNIPGLFNKTKLESNNEHIMGGFVCLIDFAACSFLLGCVAKMCREVLHWKSNQPFKNDVTRINWSNSTFVKFKIVGKGKDLKQNDWKLTNKQTIIQKKLY